MIQLLIRAYAGPGDEVLYSRHGFLIYAIAALGVGATPVTAPETDLTADVDALLAAVTERTRMVFLANPNNPTGTCLPASEIRRETTTESSISRRPSPVLPISCRPTTCSRASRTKATSVRRGR